MKSAVAIFADVFFTTKATAKMNDKFKGYLLGAIAAATYGMNPLFALPLYADGMDADSVLLFRYLFAVPMLGAMILVRGRSFKVSGHDALRLVFMGIMVAVSSLALFLSYNYMEAGIASTLLFVYPILVALIMVLFYKERLSLLTAVCIVLAISGIALLYRGGDGTTLSLAGTLLVFLSALTYAIYIVGVNHSSLKDVATLTVTFYVLAFGVTVFLVRILAGDGLSMPTKWYLWGNLLALALFPTAISFLCTTSAIKYIGSTPTAILGALEPVTAVVIGITVFGEGFTLREGVGLVLIVTAVSLVIAGGSVAHVLLRFRKLFPRLRRRSIK